MSPNQMTESAAPAPSSADASRGSRPAVWWRFALALAIVAASTMWALTTRSSGVVAPRSPLHWKFWIHPLEWNPEARKPYLQGDLRAVAVVRSASGDRVYFGGPDGFVVRRELDGEAWETASLSKSDATAAETSWATDGASDSVPAGGDGYEATAP